MSTEPRPDPGEDPAREPEEDARPLGRGRRALAAAGGALAVALLFAGSAVLGVLLHLDLPLSRRVVQGAVNDLFEGLFEGEVRLGPIETIGVDRIRVASFQAAAPNGDQVLSVETVTIRGAIWGPLLGLVLRGGRGPLPLEHVRVERGWVALDLQEEELGLTEAFHPKPSPGPAAPPSEDPFRLVLDTVELGEIEVTGALAASLPLDGTVSRLVARLEVGEAGIDLQVPTTSLVEHSLLGATVIGTTDYHLHADFLDPEAEVAMGGSVTGHLGEVQLAGRWRMLGSELTASVDLPRVHPEALRPWLDEPPLTQPVAVRAGVRGSLPRLVMAAEVSLPRGGGEPDGRLSLTGALEVDETVRASAEVTVADLDAQLFDRRLAPSRIDLTSRVTAEIDGPHTHVAADVATAPATWDGVTVPPIVGKVEVGMDGVVARVVADEPGARTEVYAAYADGALELAVRAGAAELQRLDRLASLLPPDQRLAGQVRASGWGRLSADGELDASVSLAAGGVRVGADVTVGAARGEARLRGPLDALVVEGSLVGNDAAVGEQRLPTFALRAAGPIARPRVVAEARDAQGLDLEVAAVVDPEARAAHDVERRVAVFPASLEGHVDHIAAGGDRVTIDQVDLHGLGGEMSGSLAIERGELHGKLAGTDLDLRAVSTALGLPVPLRGRANLNLDVTPTPEGGREGHLQLTVKDAGVLVLDGLALSLDTRFRDDDILAEAALVMNNPLGHPEDHPCAGTVLTLVAEDVAITVDGGLVDPEAWARQRTTGTLGLEDTQLACLAEIWQLASPTAPIPVTEVAGVIDASLGLSFRGDPSQPLRFGFPSLRHFGAKTTGLVVAGLPTEVGPSSSPAPPSAAGDESPGRHPPPWKSDALDVAVVGALDGDDGKAQLSVAVIDGERKVAVGLAAPPLLRFDGAAELDLRALWVGGDRLREALETTPASLALQTTRSPVERYRSLPAPFREQVDGWVGEVELDAFAQGTARDPSLALRLQTHDLGQHGQEAWQGRDRHVDVMVSYSDAVGRLDGHITERGRRLAWVEGESKGDLSVRLLGHGADPRWTGWATAHLEALPLDALPPLAESNLRGEISGRLSVQGLGEDPALSASLRVPQLWVGPRIRFDDASIEIRPLDEPGRVSAVVLLPNLTGGGSLKVSGYGSLAWERQLIPGPDYDKPAGLYVSADRFPLATLQPFAGDSFAKIGGELGGEAHLGYRELHTEAIALQMDMRVHDGAFQLTALGQDIHGLDAHVVAQNRMLAVEELELHSGSGRATGSLRAGLSGLGLNVLTGSLTIAEDEPIRLASQGVPIGNVSGQIDTNIGFQKDGIEALLVARNLKMQLPPSTGNSVQELEPHPDVTVVAGSATAPPKEEQEDDGGDDSRLAITFTLLLAPTEITGSNLRLVFLTEKPLKVFPDGTTTGEITVTEGELTVLDKTFRVERGTVVLKKDDPTNPYLNVTASWEAPDASTVYVDYVGRLKPMSRDNFTFRSNPPRAESEVLALLVFGDAE
ncbi:MAG: translocation/assembly module TamB domain-containing protein, partial [Myxococcales bacterium]|nr:translocation/assembly module TamB domain-containing protein [Myxococcales bacterium]